MKKYSSTLALLSIVTMLATAAVSVSTAQELSLKGRSAFEVNLGFWGGAKVSNLAGPTGVQFAAGTNGFAGGLAYSYWLKEHLALTLSASMESAQARTTVGVSGITQQSSAVFPLLLGIRFYIPAPQPDDNVRPFLSVAAGPYFGSEVANTQLGQQAHVETALGGRLGAGVDFFPGNHFVLIAGAGYHLMTDFGQPVGARTSYNGAEFSLGAGYVF